MFGWEVTLLLITNTHMNMSTHIHIHILFLLLSSTEAGPTGVHGALAAKSAEAELRPAPAVARIHLRPTGPIVPERRPKLSPAIPLHVFRAVLPTRL